MGQQDVVAGLHELAAVAGFGGQAVGAGGALPLLEEAGGVLRKGERERAHGLGEGGVVAVADADAEGEFAAAAQVELAGEGEVAVGGGAELPVHVEVVGQVAPAVAGSDEAATDAGEAAVGGHGQGPAVFPGEQHFFAGDIDGAGGVAGAAAIHVRGEQGVDAQLVEELFAAVGPGFEADVHQDDAVVRVADDLFDQLVAAFFVAVGVADAERFGVDVLEAGDQVALFFVDEALPSVTSSPCRGSGDGRWSGGRSR
jgi:hypothetical protein